MFHLHHHLKSHYPIPLNLDYNETGFYLKYQLQVNALFECND